MMVFGLVSYNKTDEIVLCLDSVLTCLNCGKGKFTQKLSGKPPLNNMINLDSAAATESSEQVGDLVDDCVKDIIRIGGLVQ